MANKKKGMARTMPMRVLEEQEIPYEPLRQAHKQHTAEGVAEDLGVPVAQVVKAMIIQRSDRRFVLVVIPGDRRLSLKKVDAALSDKKVTLASERDVQRVTGYRVGAVSVLGFRRPDVAACVDERILEQETVIISAGRPDVGLALSPDDLVRALDGAQLGDFCDEGYLPPKFGGDWGGADWRRREN